MRHLAQCFELLLHLGTLPCWCIHTPETNCSSNRRSAVLPQRRARVLTHRHSTTTTTTRTPRMGSTPAGPAATPRARAPAGTLTQSPVSYMSCPGKVGGRTVRGRRRGRAAGTSLIWMRDTNRSRWISSDSAKYLGKSSSRSARCSAWSRSRRKGQCQSGKDRGNVRGGKTGGNAKNSARLQPPPRRPAPFCSPSASEPVFNGVG
jgi:hypothetical protein